jgi:hypothetical protein
MARLRPARPATPLRRTKPGWSPLRLLRRRTTPRQRRHAPRRGSGYVELRARPRPRTILYLAAVRRSATSAPADRSPRPARLGSRPSMPPAPGPPVAPYVDTRDRPDPSANAAPPPRMDRRGPACSRCARASTGAIARVARDRRSHARGEVEIRRVRRRASKISRFVKQYRGNQPRAQCH